MLPTPIESEFPRKPGSREIQINPCIASSYFSSFRVFYWLPIKRDESLPFQFSTLSPLQGTSPVHSSS